MSTQVCAPWCTAADLCPPCIDMDIDPALIDSSIILASEVLYNLTGRAWPGAVSDVIRPVGRSCFAMRKWYSAVAVDGIFGGSGLGVGWAPDPSLASQGSWLSEIRLPGYPVTAVSKVMLDGVQLANNRYRIDNRRTLVALPQPGDSWGGWPSWQQDRLADTEPGTFGVYYSWGTGPPPGGVHAAAIYSCELALSASPATIGQCRLPRRVTTLTRAGVSMAIIDPLTIIRDGMVGIPEVDVWVNSVWVGRNRRRASITALDQRKPSRRHA